MKKQLIILLLSVLFLAGSFYDVFAQWISPGTLSKAHKDLRGVTRCLECHILTEGLNSASCKSCHDKLKVKKINEDKGLHSRVKSDCVTCHTDHKGADYDITTLDEKTFKHSLTGYELKDSHAVKCGNCHKKEDTYLGNSQKCLSCHADVHKTTVPEDCLQCHNYKKFKEHIFDHTKKVEFKLVGKHIEAKCELCHPRNTVVAKAGDKEKEYQVLKFKPIKSETCRDCHFDIHKKQFEGQVCDSCHSLEKGWKEYTFRHESEKYKGFKLDGKHKEVECEKCHERSDIIYSEFEIEKKLSPGKYKPIKTDVCGNCHYDVHSGQFKKQKCDNCHSLEKDWKDYIFDHQSKKFSYKLEGKHKDVECAKCHVKKEVKYAEFNTEKKVLLSIFEKIKSEDCTSCHYDIHEGQFKDQKCNACHSLEKGWKDYIFKHESKKYKGFKLEGKHEKVECEKCDSRSEINYKEFGSQKKVQIAQFKTRKSEACSDCHYDVHEGQFKDQKCDACHSVRKEWKEKTFTHDNEKYEGYKLLGKHEKVECEKCHKRSEISYSEFEIQKKVQVGLFKPLKSETCGDCHKDGHEGKFKDVENLKGVACSDCHSVENEFKEHVYKHKKDSKYFRYNPNGMVKESNCAECHYCEKNMFSISSCFDQMGF